MNVQQPFLIPWMGLSNQQAVQVAAAQQAAQQAQLTAQQQQKQAQTQQQLTAQQKLTTYTIHVVKELPCQILMNFQEIP